MFGIGAVDGIAVEKAHLFFDNLPTIEKKTMSSSLNVSLNDAIDEECRRLDAALAATHLQIEKIMAKAQSLTEKDNAEIFDYQLLVLADTDFTSKIKDYIRNENMYCEYAVELVCNEYISIFAEIDNEYLRQRTTDIADIKKRIQCVLMDVPYQTLAGLSEKVIIAAHDLTPSQTAELDSKFVKGILLEKGGKSSHTVILTRSMGVPCIVGLDGLLDKLTNGGVIIIDGKSGEVIESPTATQIEHYTKIIAENDKEQKMLEPYKHCKSVTLDGHEIKVFANITSTAEVPKLIENGGEGVGLLRTEFIYMAASSPPSEQTQYVVYAEMAAALKDKPLIIRTLDAGGDKNIAYLGIEKEENPFLGYRAIRYCLDHASVFKSQIFAILRAAACGNVCMMFPMIATIEELRRAKAVVAEAQAELEAKGEKFGSLRLGMMMETPSAAFLSDSFAKEVDFFSIGTNDLTQYLFAADRNNKKVAALNSYFHPALLKTVSNICQSAHKHGIEVDICGAAGEVPGLVPLWVAMGANLSVSIPSIPLVRKIICQTNRAEVTKDLQRVLQCDTVQEVVHYLKAR